MSEMVTTVIGREPNGTYRYHLAKGRGDADWQPIHCGGGVVFAGWRAHVAPEDVCPDCVEAKRRPAPSGEAAEPTTTGGA